MSFALGVLIVREIHTAMLWAMKVLPVLARFETWKTNGFRVAEKVGIEDILKTKGCYGYHAFESP